MEDEGGAYLDRPGNSNKMDAQSDSSSFSTDPLSDDASYKTPQVRSSYILFCSIITHKVNGCNFFFSQFSLSI